MSRKMATLRGVVLLSTAYLMLFFAAASQAGAASAKTVEAGAYEGAIVLNLIKG